MAIDLQTAFATVVHEDEGTTFARLETAFATVVHQDEGTTFARLETAFSSVVSEQPLTVAIISNTPATATIANPFTFIGSNSVADTREWSFTSVPAGSAIPVGKTPFPDGGATTPIDMTNNEVLYHANETSGTTGTDTSGNGNNATLTSITVNQPGQIGTAWQNASAIRVTPSSSVAIGSDWTLSLWFYSVKASGYATVLFASSSNHHAIVNSGTGELGVYSGAFRGSGASVTRGEAVWRHLAVVGTGGDTLFYIDGALAGTTVGYQITLDVTSIAGDTFNQYFAERVDEIAIWSRALSSTEIADIFLRQSGVYATTEDLTFTPDVTGVYDVTLNVFGRDKGEAQTDSATGLMTASVAGAAAEYPIGQAASRKPGLIGRFVFPFVPKIEE